MNQEPLFSIIIPVYNAEKYLRKCIDSIICQIYPNFELILTDDGSKDNSGIICDTYAQKDKRIKVIHQTNSGVSIARQAAIDTACGSYIVCIDADDWVESDLLEKAKEVIDQYSPDVLIYGYKVEDYQSNTKKVLGCKPGYYSKADLEREIYPYLIQKEDATYFHPSLWGIISKRNLIKRNLLVNPNATIGEDQATVIPCIANAQSMFVIDGFFYNYRYNALSATKAKKPFKWSYPEIVNKHIMSKININEYDFKEQIYRKICHDFWNASFSQFYSKKKYCEVKQDILKHMQMSFYKVAIQNAHFKGSKKADVMMFALKYKCIPAMYFYSKVRRY